MKQFENKDLVLIAQIIDQSSQRGLFKGPDLKIIGELYQKVVDMLPKQPQPQPQDVATDAKE
mgnify:CR=1 FL=1|tara:strand:+ start:346 stop:531 length:186 start_codon:yes stop_codon:yes gene_type:complete